jgi:hypothetical protein
MCDEPRSFGRPEKRDVQSRKKKAAPERYNRDVTSGRAAATEQDLVTPRKVDLET